MICRLCSAPDCRLIHTDPRRGYFLCPDCGLIFVPAADHCSVPDEKARYDLHDNDDGQEGYRRYLGEMVDAVCQRIDPSARILDFGSGKNAVLISLFREKGYDCTAYDPLYSIGTDALSRRYDAIILCEVIEHLRDLPAEIERMRGLLAPGAALFIRTQFYPSIDEFPRWWYKNDRTHINFFSRTSIDKAAAMMGLTATACEIADIFFCAPSV
jgi:hypothetical protein